MGQDTLLQGRERQLHIIYTHFQPEVVAVFFHILASYYNIGSHLTPGGGGLHPSSPRAPL